MFRRPSSFGRYGVLCVAVIGLGYILWGSLYHLDSLHAFDHVDSSLEPAVTSDRELFTIFDQPSTTFDQPSPTFDSLDSFSESKVTSGLEPTRSPAEPDVPPQPTEVHELMLPEQPGAVPVFGAAEQQLVIAGLPIDPLRLETASVDVERLYGDLEDLDHRMEAHLSTSQQCLYDSAIIYLVKDGRLNQLLLSLSLLLHNVPLHCQHPIFLFHEGHLSSIPKQKLFKDKLLGIIMGRVAAQGLREVNRMLQVVNGLEFIALNWTLPDGISSDVEVLQPVFPEVWPGYHHMCNWYFADIWQHPRIRDLDYYMRMDTDSYILDKMTYDPIHELFLRDKKYGFLAMGTDPPFVTVDFFPLVKAFAESHPNVHGLMHKNGWAHPPGDSASQNEYWPGTYHNSFEVVHIPSFRTPEMQEWVNYVTSDPEHIFKYRWGDAPLRWATMYMFFDMETELLQYCDITYYHQYPIATCSHAQTK